MIIVPPLSLLIWLPIVIGALLCLVQLKHAKELAFITSVVCLGFVAVLWGDFDTASASFQFQEYHPWFPALQIAYAIGIDGFSLPLIALTCLLTPLVVLASGQSVPRHRSQYLGAFLILQGLMCGVFSALDAILFYVFFEGMLIPMFLMIGIWGGSNRVHATFKFFLFTFFGSVFLLVALLYLYFSATSHGISSPFSIVTMQHLPLSLSEQRWLFLAMALAFAIKIPMWPVHTWLPDAHVEAPTGGSVVLAAVMLKMGAYGFLRLLLPILPDASRHYADVMVILSLIAVVYVGVVAIVQQDMKKLIAYSSVAHMGFVTLGFFMVFAMIAKTDTQTMGLALSGAYIQMISHGFVSAALFFCVGVLYDRIHSREICDYGGVVNRMPIFASFMMLFAMANAGLPGTSGFVGEFLVIISAFSASPWIAVLAATTLILSAAYTLWMYKRVIFGKVSNPKVAVLHDLNKSECFILGVLAVLVIGVGVYPKPLLDIPETSIRQLLQRINP